MDIISLENFIKSQGVSEFGFCKLDKDINGLCYAISIVFKLSGEIIDEIKEKPTYTYFHHYKAVNSLLDITSLKIGMYIEQNGYSYKTVAASQTIPESELPYSGIISHKAVARQAGLGSIGKNGLFISKKMGVAVRLATILTDMPITDYCTDENIDVCKDCIKCLKSCPAQAIEGKLYEKNMKREEIINAEACSKYMKDKFMKIGRGSVCGICISVCPYKKYKKNWGHLKMTSLNFYTQKPQ